MFEIFLLTLDQTEIEIKRKQEQHFYYEFYGNKYFGFPNNWFSKLTLEHNMLRKQKLILHKLLIYKAE